ncbi:MAG: carbohydrate-binding module family 20 domain-containing protein, partial [Chloroflexota bacterium]
LTFLLADDEAGTLAFGRRTHGEAAITILNLTDTPRTVTVPTEGWIPEGVSLSDALGESSVTSTPDGVTLDLAGYGAAVLLADPGVDLAAPAAPDELSAEASTGQVALGWSAVEDATSYRVWRSVLSGGGFQLVGTVEDTTSFDDASVRNGTRVHYVVTAVDAAGNESERSPEATGLPEVVVAEARLTSDVPIEQQLSAVEPGQPVEATVQAPPYSDLDGATVGVRVELGFGPEAELVSAEDESWTWGPMTYAGEEGGADRWTGSVRPEETGSYRVTARLSTDGGVTWRALGILGIGETVGGRRLVAVAPDDASAPTAPDGLVATSVAETGVSLAWDPVADGDLHRYEILRGRDGAELERIGVATEPAFTDDSVSGGQTYTYAVRAQDTSYNRSDLSAAIEVGAAAREVAVTFTVSVPPNTTAGDSVFIAGDFQGWDPGATPMTRVDDTTWEITIPFAEATPLQYKYTRGSWEAVEKDAGCGEIPNRELTVQHGTEGALAQADEVAKWRDLANCP